jgi:hypothetical protein
VVVDQEPACDAFRRRLAELLRRANVGRRAGDADVDHLARSQLDHEERDHGSEEDVGQRQDVARPGLVPVGAQERRPGLAGGARRSGAAHVALDGALAGDDAEREQLTPDPLGGPPGGCRAPSARSGPGSRG